MNRLTLGICSLCLPFCFAAATILVGCSRQGPSTLDPGRVAIDQFNTREDANRVWYTKAEALGVPQNVIFPKEIAATTMTTQRIEKEAKRQDWKSLPTEERTKIIDDLNKKSDQARDRMRTSLYKEPFKPDW